VERRTVYVVDDDDAVRDSLSRFLRIAGFDAEDFSSASQFLDALPTLGLGCLVLDIHMPGLSGLDAQQFLNERGSPLPVIILTGSGDIAMAVRAMKNGAVEFIEKPYEDTTLLAALEAGFERLDARLNAAAARERALTAVDGLSPREREVLQGMLAGLPNKLISHRLGLSTRTVEVYRANLMEKLGVRSLSAALRLGLAAGLEPMADA
jgi:two-component system response regulator FixJ